MGRMYDETKTWNPFKGCEFDCTYCKPSFQAQAKRQKQNCLDCYHYRPHYHPERLQKRPSAKVVFVCGNADISFCEPSFTREIIASIKAHNSQKEYYFQSKQPEYFSQFLTEFPSNVTLVTTLETNRDAGYREISKAPVPSVRYEQFKALDWPNKVVTVEPVMDFDLKVFKTWLISLKPLYVWIGYNSRPKQVKLPEPDMLKVKMLQAYLGMANIKVREKDLRK